MLTGAKATNRKLHEQSLIQTLQAPKIISNAGWSFIVYEPNSRTPFKPGIVALAPGSQLRFEVDTSRAAAPSVSFQYLESRVGMGILALECGGCVCERAEIDATGQVARLSTLVTREVLVTSHPHCQITLTLLNKTSSADQSGHKFKLARLFVTGAAPSSLVADATSAQHAAAGSTGGGGATAGALPLRGMRARFCRGPMCAASAGKRRGRASEPAEAVGPPPVGHTEVVDGAISAARDAALSLLRAARTERPSGIREASLNLLLPPSHPALVQLG